MTASEQKQFLKATSILEVNHESTKQLIAGIDRSQTKKQQAIDLYVKVRDGFVYNPYHLDLRPEKLKSSIVLQKKKAWCVEKSIVLATGLRALHIPSRLGYGIVVNHIGVEKLTKFLKREEIVFHGYVEAYLDGEWVKSTPAFDPLVCKLSGVEPLEWDGENDSLFQAYKGEQKFMEYKHFYGEFDDVPVELMNTEMRKYYPHLFEKEYNSPTFSFFHLKSK